MTNHFLAQAFPCLHGFFNLGKSFETNLNICPHISWLHHMSQENWLVKSLPLHAVNIKLEKISNLSFVWIQTDSFTNRTCVSETDQQTFSYSEIHHKHGSRSGIFLPSQGCQVYKSQFLIQKLPPWMFKQL